MRDSATTLPETEVTISPELRALFRGAPPVPPAPPVTPPQSIDPLGWHRIVLRRDGMRPLSFSGVPLYRAETRMGAQMQMSVALYLGEGEAVYAGFACRSENDTVARPIYAARKIANRADMAALLDTGIAHAGQGSLPSPAEFQESCDALAGLLPTPSRPKPEISPSLVDV